jgi:hypothetical protein
VVQIADVLVQCEASAKGLLVHEPSKRVEGDAGDIVLIAMAGQRSDPGDGSRREDRAARGCFGEGKVGAHALVLIATEMGLCRREFLIDEKHQRAVPLGGSQAQDVWRGA